MLANRRENFGSHPLLELLGFRFAGPEDQGVQAGLVDDVGGTLTPYVKHRPLGFRASSDYLSELLVWGSYLHPFLDVAFLVGI